MYAPRTGRYGEPPASGRLRWGPPRWTALHSRAIQYPHSPTARERRAAGEWLRAFLENLPCPMCRQHALTYARLHPPDLSDTYSFQVWAWEFHNAVNRRLGARQLPFEAYLQEYDEEIKRAHFAPGRP